MQNNQKGFLLISIIFIMLLMAVSIFSINYYSVTQIRIASNQIDSVQTGYDMKAIIEDSVWRLTDNLFWRTDEDGEDYSDNLSYTRIVRNAVPYDILSSHPLYSYRDAVTIQVIPKGSDQSFQKSFRYYAKVFVGADADLDEPMGIYVDDSSGNIYIASKKNHIIWKINTFWNITAFAGTGEGGYSGDGGAATSAKLDEPHGVFGDSLGNIYIADKKNHIIRKVDTNGIITTIAGTPKDSGYVPGAEHNVAATSAHLNEPRGIYVDSSDPPNIYIADTGNHIIRKVDTNGIITKIAGTPKDSGYVPGAEHNVAATSAHLNEPRGIYVDSLDPPNIYIADTKHHIIRKVDTDDIITNIAGTPKDSGYVPGAEHNVAATSAHLNEPRGIYVDSLDPPNIYIADTKHHIIRKVDTDDIITNIAGTPKVGGYSGDGFSATDAELNEPSGIYVDSDSGDLYIADTMNNVIRRVDDTTQNITTVVSMGSSGYSGDKGPALLARLNEPKGIFKDSSGNLYIADRGNHVIRMVDTDGEITTVAGTGISGDTGDGGLATDAQLDEPHSVFRDGTDLYIADTKNHKIRKVDLSTNIITTIAGGGWDDDWDGWRWATSVKLNEPYDVYMEGTILYIADTKNNRIRMMNQWGWIRTYAGTKDKGDEGDGGDATDAKLGEPRGIFKDSSGNLFIADTENHKIRKVDTDEIITTVAGTGDSGSSGDGDLATLAKLKKPVEVFVDPSGNIFIVDLDDKRIRVVNAMDGKIYSLANETGASGDTTDLPAVETKFKDPAGITMDFSYGGRKIFISDTGNHKIKVLSLKTVYGL